MNISGGDDLRSLEMKAVRKKISALYKEGKLTECILECNNAIEKGCQDASIYNTKAVALLQLGEAESAKRSIDIAVQLAPDNAHYAKNKDTIYVKADEKCEKPEEEKAVSVQNKHQGAVTIFPAQPSSSHKSENKPHTFIVESAFDPAEEIRKYKVMLDNGVIDQNYFEAKREELQNFRHNR